MTDRSGATLDLRAVIDDDASFRAWHARCAPRVYAYFLSRVGAVSVAEDLTQDVFLEAIRKPGTYDGRDDSLPWLIGIARHRLARHFRVGARDEGRTARLIRDIETADRDAEWQSAEARGAIALALAGLPPDQRLVLILRFLDHLSVRDVAAELGRSEDATESLLRRARDAFERRFLEATDAD